MLRVIIFLVLIFKSSVASSEVQPVYCFIAKENGKVISKIGKCDTRTSPFSTFKVPLALIGFDLGILKNPSLPVIAFDENHKKNLKGLYDPVKYPIMLFWDNRHTPSTWIKYSVIWYSQFIALSSGQQNLKRYLTLFNYGNKDTSGNPGKHDGLLSSWIGSSLKISPEEQMDFIEKLSNGNLPISQEALNNTKQILKLENIWDDWSLYGKTGGSKKQGWFIGWIEKNDRKISFVQYLEQPATSHISGGLVAKELAKNNIIGSFSEKSEQTNTLTTITIK